MNSREESEQQSPIDVTREQQSEKIADSARSATNRFRDRFEYFLHQETLQEKTKGSMFKEIRLMMNM